MAKKAKYRLGWLAEVNTFPIICRAKRIGGIGTPAWAKEEAAGLIYRTKREALACARRMLKAAKEG